MTAEVNVTWNGQNGTLPSTVDFEATDQQILTWITESIQTGSIPGIDPDPHVNIANFHVERIREHTSGVGNRIFVHPQTKFGLT